jgi:hypothetical protein
MSALTSMRISFLSELWIVQKYLRPGAVRGGVIPANWKGRFGFHNFRHSLATTLVKLKVDPGAVPCSALKRSLPPGASHR